MNELTFKLVSLRATLHLHASSPIVKNGKAVQSCQMDAKMKYGQDVMDHGGMSWLI